MNNLKDFQNFKFRKTQSGSKELKVKTKFRKLSKLKKPENILVSFDLVNGEVTNFEFKLADWGTAGWNGAFHGGTPGYASSRMFKIRCKDFFSIGRMAMELFVGKTG